MSDVKTTVRTLKVFEAFAAHPEPMTLSELSARIGSPVSSCLLIIRTLLGRGYLHMAGRHQSYYPTPRLLDLAVQIARHDPLLETALPLLQKFRDQTGETITFAKRQGDKLIYLASAESDQTVRVVVPAGTLRPLHSTATGKALLSALTKEERAELVCDQRLPRITPRTITDPEMLDGEIAESAARGYFTNSGEGAPELSSVSVPLMLQGEPFALSLLAPSYRLDPEMAARGAELQAFARILEDAFQTSAVPERPRGGRGARSSNGPAALQETQ